jgi:hypothetical protein
MSSYANDEEKGAGKDGLSRVHTHEVGTPRAGSFAEDSPEKEVFASGVGNVDFRTVHWLKGNMALLIA